MFFASLAYAQTGGAASPAAAPNPIMNVIPIVLIVLVFYFFILRPQSKKAKQHKEFLTALKRGDKVVTGSGIIGTVSSIDDARGIVTLEVAKNTQIKFVRSQITAYHKLEDSQK